MECRLKGMLTGNSFAWNAGWPGPSLCSSATLASLVNSERLTWLEELSGINGFCYLYACG